MAVPIEQTPERLAWMRAINESPRDRLKQLVFADWLEERDDPLSVFLRVGLVGLFGRGGIVEPREASDRA